MAINERVKQIRKALHMNQKDFGSHVGLAQSSMGQVETGVRSVTDRTILLICEKFNVREEWLRDGIGDMFNETDTSILSQLANEYGLDPISEKIVGAFLKLKPEQRKTVNTFVMNLVDSLMVDYESFREAYSEERVLPFAAAGGDVSGLEEAAQLYDNQEEAGE